MPKNPKKKISTKTIAKQAAKIAKRHLPGIISGEALSFTVTALLSKNLPDQTSRVDRKLLLNIGRILGGTHIERPGENRDNLLKQRIDEYCWKNKIDIRHRDRLAGALEIAKLNILRAFNEGKMQKNLDRDGELVIARSISFINHNIPKLVAALGRKNAR